MTARVVSCHATPDYKLHVRFSDGVAGDVYLGNLLNIGAFSAWRDKSAFLAARVGPDADTICWPVGVRLDAAILRWDIAARAGSLDFAAAEYLVAKNLRKDGGFQRFMRRTLDWDRYVKDFRKFDGSDAAQMKPKRRRRGAR